MNLMQTLLNYSKIKKINKDKTLAEKYIAKKGQRLFHNWGEGM